MVDIRLPALAILESGEHYRNKDFSGNAIGPAPSPHDPASLSLLSTIRFGLSQFNFHLHYCLLVKIIFCVSFMQSSARPHLSYRKPLS